MSETQDLAIVPPRETPLSVFGSIRGFEAAQRMAKALASSDLVPEIYRGEKGVANCLIAMEVASRTGASVLAVTQNLNVIHGRPSWSSAWIIGAVNTSGRFASELRFDRSGTGDERGCVAWAVGKDGQRVYGPPITIGMAKKEGWYQKNGSKWQSLPDLMLMYRAASFFGRLYASDLLLGLQAAEEAEDLPPINVTPPPLVTPPLLVPGPTSITSGQPLPVPSVVAPVPVTPEAETAAQDAPKRGRPRKVQPSEPQVEQHPAQMHAPEPAGQTTAAPIPRLTKPVELF